MGLWQGILIVISCVVVGLVVGFLLMQVLRRKKQTEHSVFNKEGDFPKIKGAGVSFATTFVNGTNKSNGQVPLEVLIKNHQNGITTENPKQPVVTDFRNSVEAVSQKKTPTVEKVENPTQPAISWTKLVTPSNQLAREESQKPYELPIAKEPLAVNQTSTPLEGEPKKSAALSVLAGSASTNQTANPVEKKQKKVAIPTTHKKPDMGVPRNPPVTKEQKKYVKPPVQETGIANPEEIKSAEKAKEYIKSSPPEVPIPEQKIIPPVEKQEISAKSDFITELQTNLTIANTPWADKLISFQTKCWTTNHGESNPLLTSHHQELIQLYVYIGLANNIVWLATEIGHRSQELDDSYIKLCQGIADNIKKILR